MTRRALGLLLVLACTRSVSAQIAYDACTDITQTTGTTQSGTHTPAGVPTSAWVGVTGDPTSDLITGCTYGAVTMTRVDIAGVDLSTNRLYIYMLLGPPAGSVTVTCTASSNSTIWPIAVTYTGTATSGSWDAKIVPAGNASATSFATALTTVADNSWMILAGRDPQGVTAGTGSTFRCGAGSFKMFDSNGVIHPAGSNTMTITGSPADKMYTIGVSVAPPSGAKRSLTLLGVGEAR